MERLTNNQSKLQKDAPSYEVIYKKLAEYEDLEEQGLLIKTNEKNALKNAYNRGFARGIDCLYSDIDFRLQTEGSISREYLRKLVDYILND